MISTTTRSLDNQVYAIVRIKQHPLIDKRYSALGREPHFACSKLELQAGHIGRLEQARTYQTMNLNCGADDVVSDRIEGSVSQHAMGWQQTRVRFKFLENHREMDGSTTFRRRADDGLTRLCESPLLRFSV